MATWEKAFDTFQWENRSQSTNTPLDATHLNKVNDALDVIDDRVIELQGADADMEEEIAGKQDALTFDDVPTDGSNNPVKSNGIYDALNGKVDKNGTDRLMTADEGTKLAGIAAGAQVNVLEGVKVNGSDLPITSKKVNIDLSGKTDLSVIAMPFYEMMGYFKGAYVTYNGKLYEFTQQHSGAWDANHVRQITADQMFVRAGNGGYNTGDDSTTEGSMTRAEGEASHAEGLGTIANSDYQHAEGKYNVADTDDKYALIVGNGTADNARSNAMTIDWKGNLKVSGDIADGNGDVTVEGNPVQFDSPFEQDAKSVVVSVKPIQDLHGYDHPWVGGTGKNKLPLVLADIKAANTDGTWNGNVYTHNNGTVEVLTDNGSNVIGVKVNGIFNNNTFFKTSNFIPKESAAYILNGVNTASEQIDLQQYVRNESSGSDVEPRDLGLGATIGLLNSNTYSCYIRVAGGVTITNKIVYPMIRLATESDATFAPYSNICPISGIDEVEIEVSDGESEPTTTTIPLPSTLYDADVDVTNGSGNSTHAIVDLSTLSWTLGSGKRWATSPINTMKSVGDSTVANAYCSTLPIDTKNNITNDESIIALSINSTSQIIARNGSETDPPTGQLVYELATPTTISFTPADVELLEGTNVVSTNAEKVAVTYGRSLWQDINDLKTDTEGKLDKSDVADIEGDTASKAYSVNDFMLRADGLYKVTAPIASGASITASNTTKTTVGEVLTALLNA